MTIASYIVSTLETETLTACPVCGSTERELYHQQDWHKRRIHYDLCKVCGVAYLNPRMTDAQTEIYYREVYRTLAPDIPGRQEKRAAYWMGLIAPYLRGKETSLEIGCSQGYIMRAFAGVGLDVSGVEPDTIMSATGPAHRYKVYPNIQSIPGMWRFDVFAMAHVLEHINRPVEFLRAMLHRANPGAIVIIEVPNRDINKGGSPAMHHPLAFDGDSLDGLMARVGCTRLERWTHGLGLMPPHYLLGVYALKRDT